MDSEFHYYVNAIIARLAGFSDHTAQIIAYSAQFVDDNCNSINILLNSKGSYYTNTISQTYNIMLTSIKLKQIYSCFHFQPSATCFKKFWITKADSKLSNKIIKEAMKSSNPFMIGIASHAYADTFAHENFIGDADPYNNFINFASDISYGHLFFGELPDMIGIKWLDVRRDKIVDNNKKFLKAAINLLAIYCYHNNVKKSIFQQKKRVLYSVLKKIFGQSKSYYAGVESKKITRINQYLELYYELFQSQLSIYKSNVWLDEAALYCSRKRTWLAMHDLEKSHWYNFQNQIKDYKLLTLNVINTALKKHEHS